jgi:hypothetical protein
VSREQVKSVIAALSCGPLFSPLNSRAFPCGFIARSAITKSRVTPRGGMKAAQPRAFLDTALANPICVTQERGRNLHFALQTGEVANSAVPAQVHSCHTGAAVCIPTAHPRRAGPCGLRCALPSCSPESNCLALRGTCRLVRLKWAREKG